MNARPSTGPWRARGYDVWRKGGEHVAYCGPNHTPESVYPAACRARDEANARFIALAPEMAEVIADLLKWVAPADIEADVLARAEEVMERINQVKE